MINVVSLFYAGVLYYIAVTAPIYFDAYRSSTYVRGDYAIISNYDGTNTNTNGVFNVATGRFTAPVSGAYVFMFNAMNTKHAPTIQRLGLVISGPTRHYERIATMLGGVIGVQAEAYISVPIFAIASMNAGEQAHAEHYGESSLYDEDGGKFMHFAGYLLHKY